MGRKNTFGPALRELMKDGTLRSAVEIAALLGCGEKCVRVILANLMAECKAHIESYRGKCHCAYFRLGAGENAAMPEFTTPESERAKRWRVNNAAHRARVAERKLDEKYRASDAWWPHADPVVANAFSAMVRSGCAA